MNRVAFYLFNNAFLFVLFVPKKADSEL